MHFILKMLKMVSSSTKLGHDWSPPHTAAAAAEELTTTHNRDKELKSSSACQRMLKGPTENHY